MTSVWTQRLGRWSIRLYGLFVLLYPHRFRSEFGDLMTQAFGDLVRDARGTGLAGVVALWMRTLGDLLTSVLTAYLREGRQAMGRAVAGAALVYAFALVVAVGYGATRFGEFYDAPPFSRFGAPASVQEDTLIAEYEEALTGDFGRYRAFAGAAGLVLALLLGVAAALFGLWQRSLLHGAGALLGGAVLTGAAVSLLPTIWFPLDRYPVSFVWAFSSLPIGIGAWILVTVIGWHRSGRMRIRAA